MAQDRHRGQLGCWWVCGDRSHLGREGFLGATQGAAPQTRATRLMKCGSSCWLLAPTWSPEPCGKPHQSLWMAKSRPSVGETHPTARVSGRALSRAGKLTEDSGSGTLGWSTGDGPVSGHLLSLLDVASHWGSKA